MSAYNFLFWTLVVRLNFGELSCFHTANTKMTAKLFICGCYNQPSTIFALIRSTKLLNQKLLRESHSVIFEATHLDATMSNFEPTRSYNRCSDEICHGLPTKPFLFLFLGWKRHKCIDTSFCFQRNCLGIKFLLLCIYLYLSN